MSSDTPEPLAAILAEMRDEETARSLAAIDDERTMDDLLNAYADRIEAAAEREYEEAENYFAKLHDGPSMICTAKNCDVRNIGLSLAAPARNCDRYQTAEDARVAFMRDARNTEGLDHLVYLTEIVGRVCKWLFNPAEGGDHA